MSLNSEQRKAIDIIDGPLLILAGAGSWKTHTLTERVAVMIQEIWIAPESILCVTFTNKAAREMRERVAKKLGRELPAGFGIPRDFPLVSTFHSMGVMFLRMFIDRIGYERNFAIYDTDDSISLIKSILEEKKLDPKEANPRKIQYEISLAKNSGLSPDGYASIVESHFQGIVADIYPVYQERLRTNNALDFDDILTKTLQILAIPEVLGYFHNRFQYFCVDEYQDTNAIQYQIIELLASQSKNLCVVGDDWQGIYSWRGANIQNILNFKKDFPEAQVVKLEQNYRSTKNIIGAANVVIMNNRSALEKKMWTDEVEGEKIEIHECQSEKEEAEKIATFVEKDPSNWAVLYRTNGQSRVIEEALIRHGVPYEIVGGLKFYDRREIKDMVAYLRLLLTPTDSIAWKRIVNVPTRKIGPTTVERVMRYVAETGVNFFDLVKNHNFPPDKGGEGREEKSGGFEVEEQTLPGFSSQEHIEKVPEMRSAAIESVKNFTHLLHELLRTSYELPVRLVIDRILQLTKYQEYLEENFSPPEVEARMDTINELKNLASRYDEIEPRESLMHFLEDITLITEAQEDGFEEAKVTLMTTHSAKWLEFEHVIIAGAEEGIFPHARTLFEADELEEERRLFYVAMTRAKKKLMIMRANERYSFGTYTSNIASRFIEEIPEEYREMKMIRRSGWSFASDMFSDEWSDFNFSQEEWGSSFSQKKTLGIGAQMRGITSLNLGDRVNHQKFGIWTIVSLAGDVAQIAFKNGIKSMNIRIAPLEKV